MMSATARRRTVGWLLIGILLTWLGYGLLGETLSERAAEFLAARRHALSFKTPDVPHFLLMRMREVALLLTLVLGLSAINLQFSGWYARRFPPSPWRWLLTTAIVFAQLNVAAWGLEHTAVFWMVANVPDGSDEPRGTFRIKNRMLLENTVRPRVAMWGNSQLNAVIEEEPLNRALGTEAWFYDLYFKGASLFDLLLIQRHSAERPPEYAIIYVSELNTYKFMGDDHRFPPLLTVAGLRDYLDLGGRLADNSTRIRYAALYRLCPLFGLRSAITEKLFGVEAVPENADGLAPEPPAKDAPATPKVRFSHLVANFPQDDNAELQKRSLERLIQRAAALGTKVILLPGEVHPLLAKQLPSDMRSDMMNWLRDLDERHEHVVLLNAPGTPFFTAEEFRDATHVLESAQQRYTHWLAEEIDARQLLTREWSAEL